MDIIAIMLLGRFAAMLLALPLGVYSEYFSYLPYAVPHCRRAFFALGAGGLALAFLAFAVAA